ncbi:hypothetical protein ACVWWJ_001582 [Luteibacter sp. HA06]|jgi:hypothetical protein
MHLYAFGSICRGEIEPASDVDLLALVDGMDARFDPMVYSIYSYKRISKLWEEGSPFAWHLWRESRLIHADGGKDWLREQGSPAAYASATKHCLRFYSIFSGASAALNGQTPSVVFELSTVFLAMRNFATCYSLGFLEVPDFSRRSPLRIGAMSVGISEEEFRVFERARLLCTRGFGRVLLIEEVQLARVALARIELWMVTLLERAGIHE